jgi:GT2 family glycosyltransferase
MDFSIIIPNYNGEFFLTTCLPALLRSLSSLPSRSQTEIILVDNGSTDNSVSLSQKLIPQIKIIKNTKNLGFAPAVNQGIKKATGNWVVILNNDLILSPSWFLNLHQALNTKNPKIATVFGQVLNKGGTHIESQGLKFFDCGKAINIANGQKYSSAKNKTSSSHLIWGASASAVAYHRPTLLKVGLFDPDFFAYEEDVDLALRLHSLGYQTLYLPQAISYHLGSGTSSRMGNLRARMDAKNWFFIIIKNYSGQKILKNLFPILLERARNFSGLCKQTIKIYGPKSIYYLPLSILTTYGRLFLKLPLMLKKRHAIQKQITKN